MQIPPVLFYKFTAQNVNNLPKVTVYESNRKLSFILDSGSSDHIINSDKYYESVVNLKEPVRIETAKRGSYIEAKKKGTIRVRTETNEEGVLSDVLYCPDVPYNLLSVQKIRKAGFAVTFNKDGIVITNEGKVIMNGKSTNSLIYVNLWVDAKQSYCVANKIKNEYKLWHQRLGHISKSKFLELKSRNMIKDSNLIECVSPNDDLCEAYILGTQSR